MPYQYYNGDYSFGDNKNQGILVMDATARSANIPSGSKLIVGGKDVTNDIGSVVGQPVTIATSATPASGTCAVQFTFKDALGNAITHAVAGIVYLSSSDGLTQSSAITGLVVLTNGALTQLVTGKTAFYTTTAGGLLGITLTGVASSYYLTFVLDNMSLATSTILTIN